jgi:uncharacterized protein (UPF0248 family)
MKCALLLPGHVRHYKKTFLNQGQTILGPNDCDIFISTSNLVTSWVKPHEYIVKEEDATTLEEDLRSVYGDRLKGLVINPEENVDVIPSPMQWKRLKECFEQKKKYEKEKDFKYDIVFRARTDLVYSRVLEASKENLDRKKISLIRHFDQKIPVHDQFAYGHPEAMETYCNLINVFTPRNVGGRSEEQLYKWLIDQNIEIEYIENFYFKMVRGHS